MIRRHFLMSLNPDLNSIIKYTTSDGSLFDLQGILDFWTSLITEILLGASVTSNTYSDVGLIVLNTKIDRTGMFENTVLFPIFTTSVFSNDIDITKLTSVELPDTIIYIGDMTFLKCTGLQSVTVPNSVTSIGDSAFLLCSSLLSIDLSSSLKSIGSDAFALCGFTSIVIPDSVTSIGESAFYGCESLTSVVIGAGIQGDYPGLSGHGTDGWFYNCPNIKTFIVDDNNPIYDSRDNCNALIETSTNTLLWGCNNTTIPDSVKIITQNAFVGCKNFNTIEISEGITTIYTNAFADGTSINTVIWRTNNYVPITSGASSPFRLCDITSFIIGENITNIPTYICYKLGSLSLIHIPEGVVSIGDGAFMECAALTSITIPVSMLNIGGDVFFSCTNLQTINYQGTMELWGMVALGNWWNYDVPATVVHCTDGDVTL